MQTIQGITTNQIQELEVELETGENFIMNLEFFENQGIGYWTINVKYKNIITGAKKITICNNILEDEKNLLPFGLIARSQNSLDPYFLNDFSSGRVLIILLNETEKNSL